MNTRLNNSQVTFFYHRRSTLIILDYEEFLMITVSQFNTMMDHVQQEKYPISCLRFFDSNLIETDLNHIKFDSIYLNQEKETR